jgi:hypothetical protein
MHEMDAEVVASNEDRANSGDEAWSNTICPGCGRWLDLEDYERLTNSTPQK